MTFPRMNRGRNYSEPTTGGRFCGLLLRAALAASMMFACAAAENAPIQFKNIVESSGVDFVHTDGSSGKRHVLETISAGLALFDYDGDGDMDIYFLNGVPLDVQPANPPGNALYRNDGKGRFTDVTKQAGVASGQYSLGCAAADYDNDGDEDLFITNYGSVTLFRNNGNGTFADVTEAAGVSKATEKGWVGAGCAFLDFDRDGLLDLYSGNYLEVDLATEEQCVRAGVPVYCDPRTYKPVPDRLFKNNGDGTFHDVSASAGISAKRSYTMGVVCSDYDGDGWTDIYVGNDVQGNFFYHNQKNGTFKETGVFSGVAYDLYGDEQGTMGVNSADFDRDGLPDILVTAYQNQVNTLYKNLGLKQGIVQFQDVTLLTGAGAGSLPLVTWGCGLVDFDNDGALEMFVAAGHLIDTIDQLDNSSTYLQKNQLFRWDSKRFQDIAPKAGADFQKPASARGAVFSDLNDDGLNDIVVLNARSRPSILLNSTQSSNQWIRLKLVGVKSNRSAVGAVVKVTAGGRTQVDEVRAGRNYQSAEDLRLHFGLGSSKAVESVEVRWPSGLQERWTNLPAGRVERLSEGSGKSIASPKTDGQ